MSETLTKSLEIFQDDAQSGGGFAVLRFGGVKKIGDNLSLCIEDTNAGSWLNDQGKWTTIKQLLQARQFSHRNGVLSLFVGPEVVNRIPPHAQVRLSVPGINVSERIVWPTLRVAGKGQPLPEMRSSGELPPLRESGGSLQFPRKPELGNSQDVLSNSEYDQTIDGINDEVETGDSIEDPANISPRLLRDSDTRQASSGIQFVRYFGISLLFLLIGAGATYAYLLSTVPPILGNRGILHVDEQLAYAESALAEEQQKLAQVRESLVEAEANAAEARQELQDKEIELQSREEAMDDARSASLADSDAAKAALERKLAISDKDLENAQRKIIYLERQLAEMQEALRPIDEPEVTTSAPTGSVPYSRTQISQAINGISELQRYPIVTKRKLTNELLTGECLANAMRAAFGRLPRIEFAKLKGKLPNFAEIAC